MSEENVEIVRRSVEAFTAGDVETMLAELIRDIGAHPVDAGALSAARLVEPAMMLLVSLAYSGVPRDISIRLLERTGHA
jgi:predicted dinucleotide-binding enzyme